MSNSQDTQSQNIMAAASSPLGHMTTSQETYDGQRTPRARGPIRGDWSEERVVRASANKGRIFSSSLYIEPGAFYKRSV
jgi:hypothetical protein